MLSRIGESLFWIGRYIERADDQARVLSVYLEHNTETDSDTFGVDLCRSMGASVSTDAGPEEAWALLGTEADSNQSMVTALGNCRDSARRAREILSMSTWEAINRAYRMTSSGRLTLLRPSLACREVQDRCAMIIGTLHATMPRDQAWHFLMLGRYIERIDMMSRIIYSTVVAPTIPTHRHLVLQSCGAQQSFVRTRGREDSLVAAVDFLLRDRLTPRSIYFCLTGALDSLQALDPEPLRSGFDGDTQRILGSLRAKIEYMQTNESLENLGELMQQVQESGAQATQALTARYFEGALPAEWHER
ncbi:alpha-E domain-containing protein [Corynebacterium sputi]|uniref:alpha-E domain-containing protein n=1 Tax=Corynebacterium sputi TaxID=489915 RepID=UPI0004240A58|nr:alpha-E domain-containing protein [Corynebacterium sputi]